MPIRRWLVLALLLIAEVLLFSVSYDSGSLAKIDAPWAIALGHASLVGQFGITAVVVLLCFGGHGLMGSLQRSGAQLRTASFPWFPFAVHLIAATIFFWISGVVFGASQQQLAFPGVWIGGWLASGAVTILSWVAALLPLNVWRAFLKLAPRVLFLGFIVALAAVAIGQLADLLWRPLGRSTLWLVSRIITLCYSQTFIDAENYEVGTTAFSVQIAPGCSGYEGIGLIIAFLSSFLWWFRSRLRFPRAFLLFPLGIVAIWIANSLRIAGLIIVGNSISPAVAQGGFHSQMGWLAFNALALGLCALAWNSSWFIKASVDRRADENTSSNPAACYLVPFLALILGTMTTNALGSDGFDRFYLLRVLAVATALWYFRDAYLKQGLLSLCCSWQSVALGSLVFLVWMALEPLAGTEKQTQSAMAAGIASLSAPWGVLWLVFRSIGSVITVPIAEELAFRGYLTRRLIAEDFESVALGRFTWLSFIASSLVFGLLHGRWLAGSLAGAVFAVALYRRRNLMDAVVAHATANGLITTYVLVTGNWSSWS